MTEELSPAAKERIAALFDMAGTVAQLVLSDATREGRIPDRGDYVAAAMNIVGAAYELAKLGGEEGVRDYLEMLRGHVATVERAVD